MSKTFKNIFYILITLMVLSISFVFLYSCSSIFSTYQFNIDNIIGYEFVDEKYNYILSFDTEGILFIDNGKKSEGKFLVDDNVITFNVDKASYTFLFRSDDLVYYMNKNIYLLKVI